MGADSKDISSYFQIQLTFFGIAKRNHTTKFQPSFTTMPSGPGLGTDGKQFWKLGDLNQPMATGFMK